MGELIPNIVLTVDKEGAPALIPTREKVKLTKQSPKVLCFIMLCSIHHLDNQLLGKAVPIKESQDKSPNQY